MQSILHFQTKKIIELINPPDSVKISLELNFEIKQEWNIFNCVLKSVLKSIVGIANTIDKKYVANVNIWYEIQKYHFVAHTLC